MKNTSSNSRLKLVNPDVVKLVGANASILFQHISYWCQTQNTEVVYRSVSFLISDLEGALTKAQIYYARKKLVDSGLITVSIEHSDKFNRTTFYRFTDLGKLLCIDLQTKKLSAKQSKNTSQNQFKATSTKQEGVSIVEINKTPSSEVKAPESLKNDVVMDNSKTTCIEDMKIDLSLGCDEETSIVKAKKEYIPKHLYAQHMKQVRIYEQQNKEFFVPKSMRESFEKAGEIRRDVVKGIPKELLSDPRLSKMIKNKQRNL